MTLTRWWVVVLGLSAVLLSLDWVAGVNLQFPLASTFPVLVATWFLGVVPGVGFAILLPVVSWTAESTWEGVTPLVAIANAGIDATMFVMLVALAHRIKTLQSALEHKVETLEGILPICGFCKKIRTTGGAWQRLESYIGAHSQAMFSHGLCPACLLRNYPEYVD